MDTDYLLHRLDMLRLKLEDASRMSAEDINDLFNQLSKVQRLLYKSYAPYERNALGQNYYELGPQADAEDGVDDDFPDVVRKTA